MIKHVLSTFEESEANWTQNQECFRNRFFGCEGIFYHEFVMQAKRLTRTTSGSFCNTFQNKSAENVPKNGGNRTEWRNMTYHTALSRQQIFDTTNFHTFFTLLPWPCMISLRFQESNRSYEGVDFKLFLISGINYWPSYKRMKMSVPELHSTVAETVCSLFKIGKERFWKGK